MRYIVCRLTKVDDPEQYVIYDQEERRLASVHVHTHSDALTAAAQQDYLSKLKAHWPEPSDTEVRALLSDLEFMPETLDGSLGPLYRLHMASETVARRRARLAA